MTTKINYRQINNAPLNVLDFGADATGISDSTAACQAAVDACQAQGGGEVLFPEGTYLLNGTAGADGVLNGILIPYTDPNAYDKRVILRGQGRSTVLKAGTANMVILRISDSHCRVTQLAFDGDNLAGVYGIGLLPEDQAAATIVFQNFNVIDNFLMKQCEEAIVFATTSSGSAGCWYNHIHDGHIYYCIRGVWFKAGVPNRNKITAVRVGQGTNTGLQIDFGDTNIFTGMDFEGVDTGTSPNATPTAIIIAAGAPNNRFFGCTGEGLDRAIVNANGYSEFHGCTFVDTCVWTANPLVCVGGYDSSAMPMIIPGLSYQSSSLLTDGGELTVPTAGGNCFAANAFRALAQTSGTGPGGSSKAFEFTGGLYYTSPGQAVSDYLVTRGAFDAAGTQYARRVSIFSETSSGTFVESTKLVDIATAGVTWTTDTVSRPSAGLTVTVNVALAATALTNYASVVRLG